MALHFWWRILKEQEILRRMQVTMVKIFSSFVQPNWSNFAEFRHFVTENAENDHFR